MYSKSSNPMPDARAWLNSKEVVDMRWKNAKPDSGLSREDQLIALLAAYAAHAVEQELERVLNDAADWFSIPDFAQSNVEIGFRRKCAAELRELAKRGALINK